MIPSTIIFISVACGAGTSAPPYPQAAFRRYRTPPIARPDTTTPIISPICCFLGVAPSRYPVFRSCDVSPAIAATIQITDPIAIAAVIPSIPVLPLALIDIVAIRSVAIAIPETGLLELPTRPTIREDTVAKKKPNTTIIAAPSNVTGIAGTTQMIRIIATIPNRIICIGRS